MSVRSDLQAALDSALMSDKVYSYWGRKQAIPGENPAEYVVYTIDSDSATFWADNEEVTKSANPAVRYYHAFRMTEAAVSDREVQITAALKSAGFTVTNTFDAGDIDEVSMNTTVFECNYSRLADG